MASMLLHLLHCRQCLKRLPDKFRDRQIAKFTRDLSRIQEKSKVRRRDTSSYFPVFLLHIIRDQPIMLFRAVLRVIPPDAERRRTQQPSIAFRRLPPRRARRTVEPQRNWLAERPQ